MPQTTPPGRAALLIACLLAAAAAVPGAGPAAPDPAPPSEAADGSLAAFPDPPGGRCWSSTRKLEAFIAGLPLDRAVDEAAGLFVGELLDQVWAGAGKGVGPGGSISAERFLKVSGGLFRAVPTPSGRRLRLGGGAVDLPERDLSNYALTEEPPRQLAVAAGLAARDPARPPLGDAAIAPARDLASLLAVALLKEAGRRARERSSASVAWRDLDEAARILAESAGLASGRRSGVQPPMGAGTRERGEVHPESIHNTALSRRLAEPRADGAIAPEELRALEASWAGLPVDPDASRAVYEGALVGVAADLYRECARENRGAEVLSSPEMSRTILARYPYIKTIRGVVNLFPDAPGRLNVSIMQHQADSVMGSGLIGSVVREAAREAAETLEGRVPSLDEYALDELSDFLSIYAVVLLRVSGSAEKHFGGTLVTVDTIRTTHQAFLQGSLQHRSAAAAAPPAPTAGSAPGEDGRKDRARDRLRSVFIEEFFSDVTARSGIDFRHESSEAFLTYRWDTANAGRSAYDSPDSRSQADPSGGLAPVVDVGSEGGGVAAADVDGDGLDDLFFAGGRRDRLYRNLGGLRFADVTGTSGLGTPDEESKAGYFVDYDNDGDQDLFVTQVRAPNRLFRNRGDGTFEDVTVEAGLPRRADLASHSATWFDFDRDGFLDLYVGNFGDWLGGARPLNGENSRNGQPDLLYRNDGHGRFEDITERAGAGDPGWTHAVSHLDANGDGWQDVYVANDFGEDRLLLNQRGVRLVDGSPEALRQRYFHAMGVGFTDANGDGVEDIYVSNITMYVFPHRYLRTGSTVLLPIDRRTVPGARMVEGQLFLVSGGESFTAQEESWFEQTPEGCGWAWDADFFDFDNDGFEDLYVVNGREPHLGYDRERKVLYKQWEGRFQDVSRGSGADFPANSRGAVHADLDRDGDLDIVVTNYHERPVLLRNNLQRHNWVEVDLRGAAPHDAVGARVELRAGGRTQLRTVRGGSGFLSKEPFRLHFGLGESESIDRIEVVWPGGRRQTLRSPTINGRLVITERP